MALEKSEKRLSLRVARTTLKEMSSKTVLSENPSAKGVESSLQRETSVPENLNDPFFEETAVEKDIRRRYFEMGKTEAQHKDVVEQSAARLREQQSKWIDAPSTLSKERFSETLRRYRWLSALSFESMDPSAEVMVDRSEKVRSFKQILADYRGQGDFAASKTSSLSEMAPKVVSALASEESGPLGAQEDLSSPPKKYESLLNPEDLPVIKKNKGLKQRLMEERQSRWRGRSKSKVKSKGPFPSLDSDFPPLLDVEELMDSAENGLGKRKRPSKIRPFI